MLASVMTEMEVARVLAGKLNFWKLYGAMKKGICTSQKGRTQKGIRLLVVNILFCSQPRAAKPRERR